LHPSHYRHIAGTFVYVIIRKTRDGWPLLTVETEANWDSKSTNERGPSLVGLFVPVQETFIHALAALVSPVQNIFSSPYAISIYVLLHQINLGRQPCRAVCL
jgi:hypothetical protein